MRWGIHAVDIGLYDGWYATETLALCAMGYWKLMREDCKTWECFPSEVCPEIPTLLFLGEQPVDA